MAPHHVMETAYNITSLTLALQFFSTRTCPYILYTRCDIHAQQRMNASVSPVLRAEPFLDACCAENEAFV